ncbi:TetR/AcrR family transcriptional regulator [Mycolicibacterium komossense]|uniref:TetR family transcriptional regulator n=1 Tax=Mycolicibacterium komossense TaxID=1779 RepID=A0ABT3CC29_9MYCO|nr:TetR/AcrR family transcriptional regulator [Mycolicibacterium komossense]MCV7227045.1 TetR family transcriptional regulator [Mycolicibacterium komossense]
MARVRNQDARRSQLAAVAIDVIAERGLGAVRVKDIAEAADVSPRLVAYYYPEIDDLIDEVYRVAVDRYYWQRLEAINKLESPVDRLANLIESGLPAGDDDVLSRALYEFSVNAGRDPTHGTLMTLLFEREVSLYVAVLEAGGASGDFTLTEPVQAIAQNFVALEDAFGMYLNGGNSSLDASAATGLLRSYARSATGVHL